MTRTDWLEGQQEANPEIGICSEHGLPALGWEKA